MRAAVPVNNGPVKPKTKRRVKMKDFFWTQIPNKKVEGTLWTELNDNKVKLNLDELDSMFGVKETKKAESKTPGGSKGKPSKPKIIQLVADPTRQQNVGIAISRLRMSYDDLGDSLMKVDETVVHRDLIAQLLKLVPTAEEIEMVQSYEGDWALVSEVDRFFNAMGKIPGLTMRLRCMQYKQSFADNFGDASENIEVCCSSSSFGLF